MARVCAVISGLIDDHVNVPRMIRSGGIEAVQLGWRAWGASAYAAGDAAAVLRQRDTEDRYFIKHERYDSLRYNITAPAAYGVSLHHEEVLTSVSKSC